MTNHRAGADAVGPLRKGDRLPSTSLPERSGTRNVGLRPSGGPRVVVTVHQTDCNACIDYVAEIESVREQLEGWGADILIINPGGVPAGDTALARVGLPVLEDPEHVIAHGQLRVIVTDEWGEVYFASSSEAAHGRIAPGEVVEWVKFIAIQCPECEGPEGEWRNL